VLRLLARLTLTLLANAVGLILAAVILDRMSLSVSGFVVAVAIFTGVLVLTQPLVMKISFRYASALTGSTALVAVLVSLIVTELVADGLDIEGLGTWLLAAVIVWAGSLIGALLLPLVLFKKLLEPNRAGAGRAGGRDGRW
jgi:hypothetical protein